MTAKFCILRRSICPCILIGNGILAGKKKKQNTLRSLFGLEIREPLALAVCTREAEMILYAAYYTYLLSKMNQILFRQRKLKKNQFHKLMLYHMIRNYKLSLITLNRK